MTAPARKYQNFLELFRVVAAGSLSAVIPITNFLFEYLPTAPQKHGSYAALAIVSAAFAVPLVYSLREFLWEWHTGILSLKAMMQDLDRQMMNLGNNVSAGSQMNIFSTKYQNLLNTIRRLYYGGGGVKIQLLSLLLFLIGIGSYLLYLSMSDLYPLAWYCIASGSLSGAFAVVSLVIFGRPYRRYRLS